VCPGLFFGYVAAKGVLEKYPLLNGEKYIFIASPNECKDDAIQVLLGVTAGKKNLIVTSVDKNLLQLKGGKKIIGILIKWSDSNNKGLGVVLSIDFKAVAAAAKMKIGPQVSRNDNLLATRELLKYFSDYKHFFSVEKEFPVNGELKKELMRAGTNPYVTLGLMPAADHIE
jgi:formylmethanofuran dehydrogenase subunit E-like metal-binding protein